MYIFNNHIVKAAVALAAAWSAISCDYNYGSGSDPVGPDDLPSVVLKKGKVTAGSVTFTMQVNNSTKAAYICLDPDKETPPDVPGILHYGVDRPAEGKYEVVVGDLEPSKDYVIYAGSTDGTTYSKVVSFDFRTLAVAQAKVTLTPGTPSPTSLRFIASVSAGADRAAYVCRRAGEPAPDVKEVLDTGEAIPLETESSIVVGSLTPATDYVIYAAASAGGKAGPISKLEMSTTAQ